MRGTESDAVEPSLKSQISECEEMYTKGSDKWCENEDVIHLCAVGTAYRHALLGDGASPALATPNPPSLV